MDTDNNVNDDKSTKQAPAAAVGKAFEAPRLHLSNSPHIRSALSVPTVMKGVLLALLPALAASVVFFGVKALTLTGVCVAAAVCAECLANALMRRKQTVGDFSAVITGVLVAFNVSPSLPLWMAALGSVFAILVAKMVFGGLGCNFINPALAGRAFLVASYPAPMTSFTATKFGSINGLDAVSSATPLQAIKYAFADGSYNASEFSGALMELFLGNVGGCIGETSAAALLAGGIFLMATRIIDYRIPLCYIGTVFALFWIWNGAHAHFTADALIAPTFHILGGGLFIGAFFMATDPVTSPITPRGRIFFGVGCGVLTFLIRKYGGYPEGVSFSIMLMNLAAPLIDRCTRPAIYGEVKKNG